MVDTRAFNVVLEQQRETMAWTRAELAARLGCDEREVLLLEMGERQPTDAQVRELADVLAVDAGALYLAAHPDLRDVLALADEPLPRSQWPAGLRALAADEPRRALLDVTDEELVRLSGVRVGDRPTTLEQFTALLLMVRHIFR